MIKDINVKKILAILFVCVLLVCYIRNNSFALLPKWGEYLGQKIYDKDDTRANEQITLDDLDTGYSTNLWNQKDYIDINGFMAKRLGIRGLYSDMGMYVTKSGYIESAYNPTNAEYEVEQLTEFRNFLDENGINLLYVNEPIKYVDDEKFTEEFGLETYSNRNADRFMKGIREANINCIDLRDNIEEEGLEIEDLFYRTDHHWTVPTGFWASKIMAQGLNDMCGYNIDMSLYDDLKFDRKEWKEVWLGEQGRKVGRTYVGLDDYVEIVPNYSTSYSFKHRDGSIVDGDFMGFVDEYIFNPENDVYENISWHYGYQVEDVINNNVEDGKILLVADSYSVATECFLSLGVHEIDCIWLRQMDENYSIRNTIIENGYDTIIVAYSQIGIGAHDDGANVNYRMFDFDR